MLNFFVMKLSNSILFSNNIFSNLVFAILYIATFTYVWKAYCVPIWHAYFYQDVPHSAFYEAIGFLIALIPVLFYRGIKNVSSWICLFLYYFGYVPIVLGLLFNYPENNDVNVIGYWVVLLIAMSTYFLIDRLPYSKISSRRTVPITIIWLFVGVSVLSLLLVYHNNIRLVDFTQVYELREQNAGKGGVLMNYITAWAGTFTFPFVICYGLLVKKRVYFIIGSVLFLFLYMIFGLKTYFLAPFILYAMYRFFLWQETKDVNLMSIFTVGILLLSCFFLTNLENPALYVLAAVFLMRTLTISGCLFAGYYVPFFSNHPNTYFNHVSFVNNLTGADPYHGEAIGKVVSEGGMNANAIFWAMDGVTAMGVTGVAIVSILFAIFLIYINRLVTTENKAFVCTLLIMPTMMLLNVSFFTFLLSEGILLIVLTLRYVKIPYNKMSVEI